MPTISFDTVCELNSSNKICPFYVESEALLKCLNDNNISYKIIDDVGPSGWPEIAYTGTIKSLILLFELFDPYSRAIDELQEVFAYWDGSTKFAEEILS